MYRICQRYLSFLNVNDELRAQVNRSCSMMGGGEMREGESPAVDFGFDMFLNASIAKDISCGRSFCPDSPDT